MTYFLVCSLLKWISYLLGILFQFLISTKYQKITNSFEKVYFARICWFLLYALTGFLLLLAYRPVFLRI